MLLQEVKEKTNIIFDNELVVPEPAFHWKEKIEAFTEASLESHRTNAIFEMRCEQAKMMGFIQKTSDELVEMLMGEVHTKKIERGDRQNHEWMYNHHTNLTLEGDECNWGGPPTDFIRYERSSFWYLPPFSKVEKWCCRFGKLNYLKRAIPYGVTLRMLELRKLNLFNAFSVLAPIEAWERKTDIDPIIVADLWELVDGKAAQSAFFFVAQW